jgi:DNA-binding cell septation regulator SpoVG
MDGDHKLTFEEFQALLLYVNSFMDNEVQKAIFKLYNKSRNNLLNFDEFNRIFL